jgi:hypothetical protein
MDANCYFNPRLPQYSVLLREYPRTNFREKRVFRRILEPVLPVWIQSSNEKILLLLGLFASDSARRRGVSSDLAEREGFEREIRSV